MAVENKKAAPKKAAAMKSKMQRPGKAEPALMQLFTDEIKDIYWAENQLVTTLPVMQKAASSPALVNALTDHLQVTKGHVARLEQIFELLGQKPQAKKCDAMEGLAKEGERIIEATDDGSSTRDAGIIMAGQKVEHYEIATYGSLVQIANVLGLTEIAGILGETLAEEKEADSTLSGIAENDINYEAAGEE